MDIPSGIKTPITIAAVLAILPLALLQAIPAFAHECSSLPPGITCVLTGFMTGGGRFNGDVNNAPSPNPSVSTLVHGLILHCDPSKLPNNLEINWKDPSTGAEHHFHLDQLNAAHCEMNTALGSPNPPTANFNTWVGNGTGTLDGQGDASIYAIFTDQSQPAGTQANGPGDWSTIVIHSSDGTLVLNITDSLFGGAQQAHMCHGNC